MYLVVVLLYYNLILFWKYYFTPSDTYLFSCKEKREES
jgi:hypothetical protein